MAKTNFTKVEEILEDGLRKMAVRQLLDLTNEKNSGSAPPSQRETQNKILEELQKTLNKLEKVGVDFYQKGGFKKEFVEDLRHASEIPSEEWEKVQLIQQQLEEFKKEQQNQLQPSNEEIIKKQRKSQVTKRFNINKKWIPLH